MSTAILQDGGHEITFSFTFTYPLTSGVVRGTTDGFTTSFLHFSLFSTALWDLANSRPVHFLMLSSHLFFCLPCLLPPFTVPCKMVLARPDERETRPYHFSLRLFTMWPDYLPDLGTDFLVGDMVFVLNAHYLAVAPHFLGSLSSLQPCCEGP